MGDPLDIENLNLEQMSPVQEYAHNPRQITALLQFISKQKELKLEAKPKYPTYLTVSTQRVSSAPHSDREVSPLTVLIKNTRASQKTSYQSQQLVKNSFKRAYEQSEVLSSLRRLAIAKEGNPKEGKLILDKILKIRPDRPTNTVASMSVLGTREQMKSSIRLSSQRSLRRSPVEKGSFKFSTSLVKLFKSLKVNDKPLGKIGTNFKVIRIPSRPTQLYFRTTKS